MVCYNEGMRYGVSVSAQIIGKPDVLLPWEHVRGQKENTMAAFSCPAPGLFQLPITNDLEAACRAFRINWNREDPPKRRGAAFLIVLMRAKQSQKPVEEEVFTPPQRPIYDDVDAAPRHNILVRGSRKHRVRYR